MTALTRDTFMLQAIAKGKSYELRHTTRSMDEPVSSYVITGHPENARNSFYPEKVLVYEKDNYGNIKTIRIMTGAEAGDFLRYKVGHVVWNIKEVSRPSI